MIYRVFISHSSADAAQVEELRSGLAKQGIRAYVCSNDVQPGVRISTKVQREIESADAVLVVYTASASSSAYVQQEIGYALHARRRVIPFVDQTIADGAQLAMLEGIEQVRFDPANPDTDAGRLLDHLRLSKERKELRVAATMLIGLGFLYVAAVSS